MLATACAPSTAACRASSTAWRWFVWPTCTMASLPAASRRGTRSAAVSSRSSCVRLAASPVPPLMYSPATSVASSRVRFASSAPRSRLSSSPQGFTMGATTPPKRVLSNAIFFILSAVMAKRNRKGRRPMLRRGRHRARCLFGRFPVHFRLSGYRSVFARAQPRRSFTAWMRPSHMMRMLSSSIPHHHGNEKLLSHQASSTGQSYAPQPFFWNSG